MWLFTFNKPPVPSTRLNFVSWWIEWYRWFAVLLTPHKLLPTKEMGFNNIETFGDLKHAWPHLVVYISSKPAINLQDHIIILEKDFCLCFPAIKIVPGPYHLFDKHLLNEWMSEKINK
jgi:hypothetical protein